MADFKENRVQLLCLVIFIGISLSNGLYFQKDLSTVYFSI